MTPEGKKLQLFPGYFNLEYLIKKPTCFKGSPSCINIIITNRKEYFKKTCILVKILDYSSFEDIFINALNIHAPIKTKIIRANNHEFMAKALRIAIMTRSTIIFIF